MDSYIVNDLVYVHKCSGKSTFRLWPEKINYYDLTILISGKLTYTLDGENYDLKSNDIMLLPPGTLRTRDQQPECVDYISFNFTILPDANLSLDRIMYNAVSDDIKKIVSLISQEYPSPYNHSKAKLISILNYILYELLDRIAIKSTNQHVKNIIKYIEENITKNLTLKDISKEIALTKEYTAFVFKKATGRTVTEYINERKMILAKDLILHEDMSLSELSVYLGYNNYNYFFKLFKQYYKVSPAKMKKH